MLLGGDVGSPPEGDRLGGLSSLLGGSAGATFTWLWRGGTRQGGKVSGRSMLFFRNTTKCIAVLNSSRDRAPSLVTSASCLQKNVHLLLQLLYSYCPCHYIRRVITIQITGKCYIIKLHDMAGFVHLNLSQLTMYCCLTLSSFTYHYT